MPAGLQVWDAAGNLIVDITSRLPRFVGSAPVGPGNPSSITNSNLSLGAVWYVFQPLQIWGFQNMDVSRPIFSVSGTTISWTYSAGATTQNMQIQGTVFYGVY